MHQATTIRSLRWSAFRLPFRQPFATSAGVVAAREGLILRLTTSDGCTGLGEASPLPERGGSLAGAVAAMEAAAAALVDAPAAAVDAVLTSLVAEGASGASVACALDTALLDAAARSRGMRVATLLAPDARATVNVNATLGAADAAADAARARREGYRCVKLKVGAAGDAETERRAVAAVREAIGSDVALRLDANGAWTEDEARAVLSLVAPYDIEYVEQPLPPGNLDALRRVREATGVAIAADEDVVSLPAVEAILASDAAGVLVVKPMQLGGLRPCLAIMEIARAADVRVVVTTTIDAGIATAAALHLAATLAPGAPACGLATAALLEHDLLARPEPGSGSPLAIAAGWMALPPGPGLGVTLDEAALRRYGLGIEGGVGRA